MTYIPHNPDFGKSDEHIDAEKFFNNMVAQYNFLKSKRYPGKIIKTSIVLSNNQIITIGSMHFQPPNAIICKAFYNNGIEYIASYYSNCQFIFSIEDKTDKNQKELEIGFGKPED